LDPIFGVLLSLQRGTATHKAWALSCIEGAWPKLIGARLAAVCRPARIENSGLVVEIMNEGWEEAVKSVQPVLLKKLQDATGGEIRTLTFRRKLPDENAF